MVVSDDRAPVGSVHRQAAALDGQLELVCGAFSIDAGRSRQSGEALQLDPIRCYADYTEMFRAERARAEGERMEFVSIVTPNNLHFPIACAALEHGFHVLSDEPATTRLAEARELCRELESSGLLYGVAHPYTSYPMLIEARQRIAKGAIGKVRKVLVEYTQGWLSDAVEHKGNAHARWRLDPATAGTSCCMADIGVHAFHVAETVSGHRVTDICATLNRTVPGRRLDDDGSAFLLFDNDAHGVLIASQVCAGEENKLLLRIYGDAGSVEWSHQEPGSLWLKPAEQPAQRLRAAARYLGATARANSRIPAGHPEGHIEAFANLYRNFAEHVRGLIATPGSIALTTTVPGIRDALRGVAFIETVVESSRAGSKWLRFPDVG